MISCLETVFHYEKDMGYDDPVGCYEYHIALFSINYRLPTLRILTTGLVLDYPIDPFGSVFLYKHRPAGTSPNRYSY